MCRPRWNRRFRSTACCARLTRSPLLPRRWCRQSSAKQIILIGDGQSEGWRTADLESWRFLDEAFARLPA
jgi:hypothetical protein